MKSTFTPPSEVAVLNACSEIGLPPREGFKFLAYFESVNWIVGRSRKPMSSWRGALRTWYLNWQDKQEVSAAPSASVMAIKNQSELARCEARLEKLRGMRPFKPGDKLSVEFEMLLARRKQLLTLLQFAA